MPHSIAQLSVALAAVCHFSSCLVTGKVDYQDEAVPLDAQVNAIFSALEMPASGPEMALVTESEVADAQRAWGDAIVHIGAVEAAGLDFQASAAQFVDSLYAFGITDVLFKPTKAEQVPFRTTRAGALSYFIAGKGVTTDFPEDKVHGGFARHPWTAVRFEQASVWLGEGVALSMGHYLFKDTNNVWLPAEFSFAYVRDVNGTLRIALHHSSFPYCGEEFVNAQLCTLPSRSAGTPVDSQNASLAPAERRTEATVSQSAVSDAEQHWGAGIVDLGAASAADVHESAVDFVRQRYSYGGAPDWTGSGVLFKPTRAREIPFRTTFDGAVSYFVAGDAAFPEDHGFALAPWNHVRFASAGITQLSPTLVVTMGHYFFTDSSMVEHKGEYSLAFVPGDTAGPKIALHHSSFPFCSTCAASTAQGPASGGASWPVLGAAVCTAALVAVVVAKRRSASAKEEEGMGYIMVA